MVLDLVCFTNLFAKTKSFFSSSDGNFVVTDLKSSIPSVKVSLSCSNTPFKIVRNCFVGSFVSFCTRITRFFFDCNNVNASASYPGAITTSQNNSFINCAVGKSIVVLEIRIPPNADTGSPAKAASYASLIEGRVAIPQALLCFKIANVGPSFLNSAIN